jgi:hypothetical protein
MSESSKRPRFQYLSDQLIVECHPGDGQEPLHLIKWWTRIFALVGPTHSERVHLRLLCNMFNASLPPGLGTGEYKGHVYTEYPHLNHPSLESLIVRCHQLYDEDSTRAPTIIFIKEGEHEVEGIYLIINYPLKIVGAGRDKTCIVGAGFLIRGTKEEGKRVELTDMTVKGAKNRGLEGSFDRLSFLCKSITFTQCGAQGVFAFSTKGRLINCVITQCGLSGIYSGNNALIELEGDQTKVDGNVTSGRSGNYGLNTYYSSSKIHLLFPLTKESVSTNNQGGNYNDRGTIETVDSFE